MITITLSSLLTIIAIIAICATMFGTIFGMFYAKHEHSVFAKKFKENLDKSKTEYENKIKELQKQDAEAVRKFQDAIKVSMGDAILNKMPLPPTEKFN